MYVRECVSVTNRFTLFIVHCVSNGILLPPSVSHRLLSLSIQMIFASFLAVGFPSTGAAGFWVATAALSDNKAIAIMLYVSCKCWRCPYTEKREGREKGGRGGR